VSGRTFVLGAAVVVVAFAAFIGGTLVGWKDVTVPPPLTEVDGGIALSYEQLRADPDRVDEELEILDLDVDVRAVAATPTRVGDVVWTDGGSAGEGPADLGAAPWLVTACPATSCEPWAGSAGSGPPLFEAGILLPRAEADGTVVLVGRAPEPGEAPVLR